MSSFAVSLLSVPINEYLPSAKYVTPTLAPSLMIRTPSPETSGVSVYPYIPIAP